jgi:fructose-specific phosphotransferase system IIC component
VFFSLVLRFAVFSLADPLKLILTQIGGGSTGPISFLLGLGQWAAHGHRTGVAQAEFA